jgi:hypothetical protein
VPYNVESDDIANYTKENHSLEEILPDLINTDEFLFLPLSEIQMVFQNYPEACGNVTEIGHMRIMSFSSLLCSLEVIIHLIL